MQATTVVAALVLVAAACGSGGADEPGDAAPGTSERTAPTVAPTTTAPARTTIPLVTVPAGSRTADTDTSTIAPPATTPSAGQDPAPDPGSGQQQPATPPAPATPAQPGNAADPGTPTAPATTLAPSGIPEIDDVLGGQEVIDPPEGAGSAIRATITPVDGLAVGDLVSIEAQNAPPNQLMAYGQCTEAVADSVEIVVLLTSCGSLGIGEVDSDGTVSVTVTVVAGVGGVDCRVEACIVGLIVFPGTDGLRAYERVTLIG